MSASSNIFGIDPETDAILNKLLLSYKSRKKMMKITGATEAEWLDSMRTLLKIGAIKIVDDCGDLYLVLNKDVPDATISWL